MGQFTSNRSMKKFSVIVTLLAAICLPVLANDPEIPSCDELKQINPNFECDGDDGDMNRNFPGAALQSGGNHHGGGYGAGIIYDPECRKWLSVDLADCPIAFNYPLYEPLCNARKWWWSLGTQTKRVAVLNASGRWTDTCEYTFYEACPILGSSCPWLRGTGGGHGSAHGVGHGITRGGGHHGSTRGDGHVGTQTHGLKDWSTFGKQQQHPWW